MKPVLLEVRDEVGDGRRHLHAVHVRVERRRRLHHSICGTVGRDAQHGGFLGELAWLSLCGGTLRRTLVNGNFFSRRSAA